MTEQQFIESLNKEGIVLTETMIQQFRQYVELLQEWNKKINLTSLTEISEIYEKHFYDSLLINRLIALEGTFCDVGSGAGFPGIPCKIAYPELTLTIIEPLKKRCNFLEILCKELKISVNIVNGRAEEITGEYDIVTARAVANLRILAELCIPLVKKEGYFITMKGSQGQLEKKEAQKATTFLGCKEVKEDVITLSEQATRVNVLYKKVKATPVGYPRAYAKIKKKPL